MRCSFVVVELHHTLSRRFKSLFTLLFDDGKAHRVTRLAIFRRFYSAILRDAPFKPLLQFFEFVCQLNTNSSLFGSVFNTLRNNFRWLKNPRGLWARDFPPFFPSCCGEQHLTNLYCHFLNSCADQNQFAVFGSVFTDQRNNFRWLKSPPGHPAGLARTPGKSL